jgi:hypothetical protein
MLRRRPISACFLLFLFTACGDDATSAAELAVVSVTPASHSIGAPLTTAIAVTFNQAVQRSSVNNLSFWAFGRWSGTATGTYSFSNDDKTVTLRPAQPFSAGECVMVLLSHDLKASDGSPLRSAGYSYQFWTVARSANLSFTQVGDPMSTRYSETPNQTSRAYGGLGADLNRDGYPDITIINEDSEDLRVFMNRADGTGRFRDFLRPPPQIGSQGSPSEVSDFNRDGMTDICVSNAVSGDVSVLLGNGDGTFGPQQRIDMGGTPRGIAVLDVDGDGDTDIVNANQGRSRLGVLLNNGQGVFGNPTFFNPGGSGHWALGAADMNNDGILDVVTGAYDSGHVSLRLGNGDGTFGGGSVDQFPGRYWWMPALGDLNGDGNADVTLAENGGQGAVLLGDGQGGLGAPVFHNAGSGSVASDVGDLDGDGDLDWVVSNFSSKNWRLFTNNGRGVFTHNQDFMTVDETGAASCSSIFDIDRDGDLDLILVDELDDLVLVMANGSLPPVPAGDSAYGGPGLLGLMLGLLAVSRLRS